VGFVYVMKAGDYCKIGITEHSVYKRMKQIQTGCPLTIEKVWKSKDIPNYKECEKALHKRFHEFGSSGEWFKFPYLKVCIEADQITRDYAYDQDLLEENRQLKQEIKRLTVKCNALEAMMEKNYYSDQWWKS